MTKMQSYFFDPKNDPKSSLEQAAAAGVVDAQSDLALLLFRSGEREEAMPWILLAAQAGDPRCQYLLGIALYNGDLLPRDETRAINLLLAADKAGIEPARDALLAINPLPTGIHSSELRVLIETLLRPMLAERLDTLLPTAIERAVATKLALHAQLNRSSA
jgi:uncharacterized protein